MGEARAKTLEFAVEVTDDAGATIPGGSTIAFGPDWTADHLLLVALVRCSIHSLAYHAKRLGHETLATGSATGRVTRRESDGRFAFVAIECRIEVELTPPFTDPSELAANAERDCFIGASLTVKPTYEWQFS